MSSVDDYPVRISSPKRKMIRTAGTMLPDRTPSLHNYSSDMLSPHLFNYVCMSSCLCIFMYSLMMYVEVSWPAAADVGSKECSIGSNHPAPVLWKSLHSCNIRIHANLSMVAISYEVSAEFSILFIFVITRATRYHAHEKGYSHRRLLYRYFTLA